MSYIITGDDIRVKTEGERKYWYLYIAGISVKRLQEKCSLEKFIEIAQNSLSRLTEKMIYKCIINSRWSSLNQRCYNGKYSTTPTNQFKSYKNKKIQLKMTKEEFTSWMLLNYNTYNDLKEKGEIPSIDRINPNGDYEISNIQMISLHENLEKRSGKTCRRMNRQEKEIAKDRNHQNYLKTKESMKDVEQ